MSSVFKGGVICYHNDVKQHVLHVPEEVLSTDGAVSKECARYLAENVRELLKADIGISFTGVAGRMLQNIKSGNCICWIGD